MPNSRHLLAACAALALAAPATAQEGLLFHLSGDKEFTADFAKGEPKALFTGDVKIVPNGRFGPAIQAGNNQVLAWRAPGNIQAQRGTLSFFWRAREPIGSNEFPIFRVGYSDHSSWDMTWLRIDWNGHGFDAFVTDNGLARTRVSYRIPARPAPDQWVHLAFTWDEATGVRLYVDGKPAASRDRRAVYDAGLYAFGPHSRTISPYQVHSRYSFMRGGDIDEIRIYDRPLSAPAIAALASGTAEVPAPEKSTAALLERFRARHGWTGGAPPALRAPTTVVRKVEFSDVRDINQWNWKGNDGIRETTWPGVYNRSRIEGRNDYFQLPDWNVYSGGGKAVTFTLPDERWNHVEIVGPAHGRLTAEGGGAAEARRRPQGTAHSWHEFAVHRGGRLRFVNDAQETPIQEIGAYLIEPGEVPEGKAQLSYSVNAAAAATQPSLQELRSYIDARFPEEERAAVVALPAGAPTSPRTAAAAARLPVVHLLIPANFRTTEPGGAIQRFHYGWEDLDAGLDGIALDLPALKSASGRAIPLNVRVKDPLWPDRDMLDVNLSVPAGQPRTLWLDTRDRLLPADKSLMVTLSAGDPGFGPDALEGAGVRLVFKNRAEAVREHVADRFQQVRDNMSFVVEEHPRDKRLALFDRLDRDVRDLLRADPHNVRGLEYFSEIYPFAPGPDWTPPAVPAGVPRWAFLQLEDLKRVGRFVDWWIDRRQIANGEFGGGLSDDTDLTEQWPGLALMGYKPDKIADSLRRLTDATFANGMWTNGLSTIRTDELHSYEEGINAISESMYLDYGNPKTVERLMATARAYPRLIERNPAGHLHIVSNYFSGSQVVRESVWEWSKPYSYLFLHPGLLLADFNGSPAPRSEIIGLADGWLSHARQKGGDLFLPAEINWRTDAERDDMRTTPGGPTALQLFAAAHRFTGDTKYLAPVRAWSRKDPSILSNLNSAPEVFLGSAGSWARTAAAEAAKADASNFDRFEAWRTSGDKKWLEQLYLDEIHTADDRMYMVTEGEWWSDRVELPSDQLQRSRLGGLALKRNQMVPGHLVSWRFDQDAAAQQVALLVSGDSRRFKVVAFNAAGRPVRATMTGWNVASGAWRLSEGLDRNGDDRIDGAAAPRAVSLEKSSSIDLTFAPGVTTVAEFELTQASPAQAMRPDVAIGREDVRRQGNRVDVMVHSLGAVPLPGGTVTLVDAAGSAISSARFGPLQAPSDLLPKTTQVQLNLPGAVRPGTRVVVAIDGAPAEITRANNQVALDAR